MAFLWLIHGGDDPNYLLTGMILQVGIRSPKLRMVSKYPLRFVSAAPFERHLHDQHVRFFSQEIFTNKIAQELRLAVDTAQFFLWET